MTKNEFNSFFENLDYTNEFKAGMEKKLSKKTNKNYIDTVSGVEKSSEKNNIVRIVGTIAACAALVGVCIGIGASMKNQIGPDDNPEQPIATEVTTTSANSGKFKDNKFPMTNLLDYSEDELLEIGEQYYIAACERFEIQLGCTTLFDYHYEETEDEFLEYTLVTDEKIKSYKDVEELFYSVFSKNWESALERIKEEDGKLYYLAETYTPSEFYEGYNIKFKEATEEKITYIVTAKFNDGEKGRNIKEVPLEFSLIPENGEWKVNSFIYPNSDCLANEQESIISEPIKENMSEEELISSVREHIALADFYSFDSMLPPMYSETVADKYNSDYSNRYEKGLALKINENNDYWLLEDESITLDMIYEDFYSIYSKNYEDVVAREFRENNGKLYFNDQSGNDYRGFLDVSEMDLTIKSKDANKIVVEAKMDFTNWIKLYCCYGYTEKQITEKLGSDYKYYYSQDIIFSLEENGWRISQYTPRLSWVSEALNKCPEYLKLYEEMNNIKDADESETTSINYNDYIGKWYMDNNEYGYEMNITSIENDIMTFELSLYRLFKTNPITVELGYENMTYMNTYDDDTQPDIEASITLEKDGTVYIYIMKSEFEEIEEKAIIFNTKVK